MNDKDLYIAILKSGQVVKCKGVTELSAMADQMVECFLYARYDHTFNGPSNTTDWYQFSFIDRNGQPTAYKVGDFKIAYIGKDSGFTNFFGREVTVHNCRTDKYYKLTSKLMWYNDFIHNELKPLLEKLNLCVDDSQIQSLINSHLTYFELENRFKSLQSSYDSLKEEVAAQKQTIEDQQAVLSEISKIMANYPAEK